MLNFDFILVYLLVYLNQQLCKILMRVIKLCQGIAKSLKFLANNGLKNLGHNLYISF